MVLWDNYGDAESFLHVIKSKLAREMSKSAIKSEFDQPDLVQNSMNMRKWRSFKRGAKLKEPQSKVERLVVSYMGTASTSALG
jgi:hypothetical protein